MPEFELVQSVIQQRAPSVSWINNCTRSKESCVLHKSRVPPSRARVPSPVDPAINKFPPLTFLSRRRVAIIFEMHAELLISLLKYFARRGWRCANRNAQTPQPAAHSKEKEREREREAWCKTSKGCVMPSLWARIRGAYEGWKQIINKPTLHTIHSSKIYKERRRILLSRGCNFVPGAFLNSCCARETFCLPSHQEVYVL